MLSPPKYVQFQLANWIVAREVSGDTAAGSCHKRGNLIINVFILVKILLNFHE